MSKFNVGDELEVIEGYASLKVGMRVFVEAVVNEGVYLVGYPSNWWLDERFYLIHPAPEP